MLGPQYQAHLKATIKQIAPENYTTELRTLAQTCLSTLTSSLQDRDVSESDNFQLSADALINTSVLSATAPENMARFTAYLCISLVLEQAFLTALGCFTPDNPIWLRVARYSQVFSNRTLSMSPYLTSVANDLNGLNAEEIASPLELLTCAQALSFSYKVSRGDKVCLSPVLRSIQFYAKDGYFIDQNLASFLDMIRNGTCEYCGDRNSDHSFEYAHGEAKITVETTPIDDVTNWTGMQAWNSCKQCGKVTLKFRITH